MNIGMILDNEFTGDLRVENEVVSLTKSGFNVFVLCLNYGNKDKFEDFHGAKIIRIKVSKYWTKKFRALTNTVFDFYTRLWSKAIVSFANKYAIDVLHVHDLYMFGSALSANKKLFNRLKVVGDLHENYVEGLKHYKFSTTFPGNLLISIKKWEKTEVEWINKLDYAITVIEEAVVRYSNLGIDKNKFIVLPNYVNIQEFMHDEIDVSLKEVFEKYKSILYVGAFDIHRGLESIVRAMPSIIDKIGSVKLFLVGTGNNIESLKNLARNLNVSNYIVFEGWQPPKRLSSYIHFADICVIPHLKTVHTDNTIPHKLFQYMLMEKPVIATNCNPIKRIIENENCGVIYNSGDSKDFASKVIGLIQDNEMARKMGLNGKSAVLEKYNWDAASKNLTELYKRMKVQ